MTCYLVLSVCDVSSCDLLYFALSVSTVCDMSSCDYIWCHRLVLCPVSFNSLWRVVMWLYMVSLTCTLSCQFQQFVTCRHVTIYMSLTCTLSCQFQQFVMCCHVTIYGVTDLYSVLSVSTVCDVLSCDYIWCHWLVLCLVSFKSLWRVVTWLYICHWLVLCPVSLWRVIMWCQSCPFQHLVTCHHVIIYDVTDLKFVLSVCDLSSSSYIVLLTCYFVLSASRGSGSYDNHVLWCDIWWAPPGRSWQTHQQVTTTTTIGAPPTTVTLLLCLDPENPNSEAQHTNSLGSESDSCSFIIIYLFRVFI